jgi:hypothetical protein
MKCPKCDGEMVSGYVYGRANIVAIVNYWVERESMKKSLIGGLFSDPGDECSQSADTIPVVTLRCHSCGFLESYAR